MNITDVGHLTSDADTGEDRMEKGVRQQGRTAWEIVERYAEAFKHDLERLGILEPTIWCRATDHIPQMIETVRQIEANGQPYRTSDGIYFDTVTQPAYGQFAHLPINDGATANDTPMARFGDALRDDLSAPQALAAIWETLRDRTALPRKSAKQAPLDGPSAARRAIAGGGVAGSGRPREYRRSIRARVSRFTAPMRAAVTLARSPGDFDIGRLSFAEVSPMSSYGYTKSSCVHPNN
jgi:cysteinyl-tRNA synthetase